jgi:hypothetical protein
MKNDLDLVIAALEAEKKSLQRMIKQSTSEHDHLVAYHHSEALLRLNHHLGILYSFRDPFYNQRQELERQEKFLMKKPKDIKDYLWKSIVKRHSKELEERKFELEEKKKNKIAFNDSQQIDDLLFALHDRKIDAFKIVLDLYDYGEVLFTREANILLIAVKLSEEYENSNEPCEDDADFILDNRIPNPLKGLGFEYHTHKRSYIYRYDLTNFKDAIDIKIFLSRLFFDVFGIRSVIQSMIVNYPET